MNEDRMFYRKLKIIYMFLSLFVVLCSSLWFSYFESSAENTVTAEVVFINSSQNDIPPLDSFLTIGQDASHTCRFEGNKLIIEGELNSTVNITIYIHSESSFDYCCNVTSTNNYFTEGEDKANKLNFTDLSFDTSGSLKSILNVNCLYLNGEMTTETGDSFKIFGTLDGSGLSVPLSDDTDYQRTLFLGENSLYYFYIDKADTNFATFFNTVSPNGTTPVAPSVNSVGFCFDNRKATSHDFFKAKEVAKTDFKSFNKIVNIFTNTALAFAIITSVICCSINIFKLSTLPNHPKSRREAVIEIGSCFICLGLLGSIKLVTYLIITTIL